ncbi:MAG: type II secretion system protein GspL [Pseudomonadota bacterium]
MPILFAYPDDDTGSQLRWVALDANGDRVSGGQGTPADLAAQAGPRRLVLALPASLMSLAEAQVVAKNRKQLVRAVPYAVEDELAEDIEELHFALGPVRGGEVPVAVIARRRLEEILGSLADAGLQPAAVVPETLCLPRGGADWVLLLGERQAVLRTGDYSGYAMDPENVAELLAAELAAFEDKPEDAPGIRVIGDTGLELLPDSPLASRFDYQQPDGTVLELLASACQLNERINLLQGPFSPSNPIVELWGQWRVVLLLLGVAAVLYLGNVALDNQRLHAQKDEIHAAITDVFRDAIPDAKRLTKPEVQMRNRLRTLREGSDDGRPGFLSLLAAAGGTLMPSDQTAVKRLRFRNGRLEIDIEARTIEQLEKIQEKIRDNAVQASLDSIRNESGRYQGRLVIGGEST